jgi:hypothetical protein
MYANPLRADVREPERVWNLLEWCWDEADKRPEIGQVRSVLEGMGSIF